MYNKKTISKQMVQELDLFWPEVRNSFLVHKTRTILNETASALRD